MRQVDVGATMQAGAAEKVWTSAARSLLRLVPWGAVPDRFGLRPVPARRNGARRESALDAAGLRPEMTAQKETPARKPGFLSTA